MISAWALIAFQSANCTGASKLPILPMCAAGGTSRNSPVPARSSTTTRVIRAASIRRRPGIRHEHRRREGHRLDDALGDLDAQRRLRRGGERPSASAAGHADQQVAPEPVYHDTIPSGLKTTSMLRHCAYLSRGSSEYGEQRISARRPASNAC